MAMGAEMRKWIDLAERQRRTVTLTVDQYVVHIIVDYDSATNEQLEEARGPIQLAKHYTARIDKPPADVGQEHIHVFAKNKQIFGMNVDGTAHDRSHQYRIPNAVAKAIGDRFPQFTLPVNNFIEWLDEDTTRLLMG